MSWTDELNRVYENNNSADVGEKMLPLSHSTANAQIEVTIKEDGSLVSACKLDKSETVTVIPVTEDSGARSSGVSPHPLNDKLCYIAGDYVIYNEEAEKKAECFDAYIKQLDAWRQSSHTHDAVKAVYAYLSKRTLIADLIRLQILTLDEKTGKLDEAVKINTISQSECFVRFRVNYTDIARESRTWADKSLQECFSVYFPETLTEVQLCYATGEVVPCTYKHPSKIRSAGDKAKLISSNDEDGLSYRGRFKDKNQTVSIGYSYSQKIHNALKWIIARQGIRIGSLTMIIWESALAQLPNVLEKASDNFEFDYDGCMNSSATIPAYRKQLSQAIFGKMATLSADSKVMILALDSPTKKQEKGRLSMTMYTELVGSDFLQNLEKWHNDTAWQRYNGVLKKSVPDSFALREIAQCAYGTEQNGFLKCKDELLQDTIMRLIPCVTEGKKVPSDIVKALVKRASEPLSYSAKNYNHNTVIETACGLLRKSIIEKKGECEMALDLNNQSRSYLFGRLLAVADKAERDTYDEKDGKERVTNAKRYWHSFAYRPYQTWAVIEERLRPYMNKLDFGGKYYDKIIGEIIDLISTEEFRSNEPLAPDYLQGYHCQMQNFFKSNKTTEEEK